MKNINEFAEQLLNDKVDAKNIAVIEFFPFLFFLYEWISYKINDN